MNKILAKHLALGKEKYFGTKNVLRSRTFHPDIRTMGLVLRVLELLHFQGWVELFLDTRLPVHEKEACEFYTNLNVLEGSVATYSVNGVELVFDSVRLDEIFHIPSVGWSKYVWTKDVNYILTSKFSQGWVELFLDTRLPVHEKEVRQFYTNLNVLEGSVATSSISGVELVFDSVRLGEIFHIPSVGLSEYVWTKDVNGMLTSKLS
ncbi:hypothetical protein RDI58_024812 [Solanum bulbocastanum]|uniref:Uncharacterized protein n=1 Tax=Solanum bulbocastanum TaxID=147425 RepID=A0AAN8SYY4_SOLBU